MNNFKGFLENLKTKLYEIGYTEEEKEKEIDEYIEKVKKENEVRKANGEPELICVIGDNFYDYINDKDINYSSIPETLENIRNLALSDDKFKGIIGMVEDFRYKNNLLNNEELQNRKKARRKYRRTFKLIKQLKNNNENEKANRLESLLKEAIYLDNDYANLKKQENINKIYLKSASKHLSRNLRERREITNEYFKPKFTEKIQKRQDLLSSRRNQSGTGISL